MEQGVRQLTSTDLNTVTSTKQDTLELLVQRVMAVSSAMSDSVIPLAIPLISLDG